MRFPADGRPHFRQRATAGLIVAESTTVSPRAVGYPFTPGLYTVAQAGSWRRLTDAVHAEGGRIFVQLQHCGRLSRPDLPDGQGERPRRVGAGKLRLMVSRRACGSWSGSAPSWSR
ncbi:hypothetical protein [Streptomyces antibioticus]|uniref:oxidoreductase n=1 Tax=Streptomyces antibioticus TaxID=1890 RepID=UPI003D73961E